MSIQEIRRKDIKFDNVQKDFFIEIVQRLRNRELRGVEQSFRDVETLNDL